MVVVMSNAVCRVCGNAPVRVDDDGFCDACNLRTKTAFFVVLVGLERLLKRHAAFAEWERKRGG